MALIRSKNSAKIAIMPKSVGSDFARSFSSKAESINLPDRNAGIFALHSTGRNYAAGFHKHNIE